MKKRTVLFAFKVGLALLLVAFSLLLPAKLIERDKEEPALPPIPTTSPKELKPTVLPFNQETEYASIVWTAINQYRQSQGLPSLIKSSYLCQVAARRTKEVVTDWSHQGFKKQAWPRKGNWGENLAKEFADPSSVVPAWIGSPSHYQNLIEPRFRYGCLMVHQKEGIFYVALELSS